ncbi:alpha/beta fold hydrolase [Haloglomus litoreum]|uniref:alpha/beta fold hydrolase n=1 Tax=Haloglomus litoreum TaxID=3034026 RepID=UPI0023E89C91|nr:alpha/beta hydrolase [Haloglomus sp. DT116]
MSAEAVDSSGRTRSPGTVTGFVETNGVETYYERRGDGPPVVFVHGAVMDTRMWAPQVDALADAYTVVSYDVRGHGRTGGSGVDEYAAELFAADLHALLGALDIERPVICGLSMGGMIAQAYAAEHPENVAGLVLADTFTAAPVGPSGRAIFAGDRLIARLSPYVSYKRLNRLKMRLGNLLAPGVSGDIGTVQGLIDDGPTMAPAELRKVVRSLGAFADDDFDVSTVTAPTQVLYGEHEPGLLGEMAVYIQEHLPNAVAGPVIVPDAGHASNLDNPAFFTETVRAFLSEHAAWNAT